MPHFNGGERLDVESRGEFSEFAQQFEVPIFL